MSSYSKKVQIIGLGYIGLPAAAVISSAGYEVAGTDTNEAVVEGINNNVPHIVEPGLGDLLSEAILTGNMRASTNIECADIYIVCVPTPFVANRQGNPVPDVSAVLSVARLLAPQIKNGDLLIIESTCPIGTTEAVDEIIGEQYSGTGTYHVAYCPERVLPGNIVSEFKANARVVGGITPEAGAAAEQFYRTFVNGEIATTDVRTAEMCKLTENAYRDVSVAFANELSILAEGNDIDVWELIRLANKHPRVDILQPGVGVGGHCIAVDPWFLISTAPKQAVLTKAARETNNYKPEWVVEKIIQHANERACKSIACLGLAFKANVGDLRESPAMQVVESLLRLGFDVVSVEPNILECEGKKLVDLNAAISGGYLPAILVGHDEFRKLEVKQKLIEGEALDFCGALQVQR